MKGLIRAGKTRAENVELLAGTSFSVPAKPQFCSSSASGSPVVVFAFGVVIFVENDRNIIFEIGDGGDIGGGTGAAAACGGGALFFRFEFSLEGIAGERHAAQAVPREWVFP